MSKYKHRCCIGDCQKPTPFILTVDLPGKPKASFPLCPPHMELTIKGVREETVRTSVQGMIRDVDKLFGDGDLARRKMVAVRDDRIRNLEKALKTALDEIEASQNAWEEVANLAEQVRDEFSSGPDTAYQIYSRLWDLLRVDDVEVSELWELLQKKPKDGDVK